MSVRVRQVLLLATPVVRIVPWMPVAAATLVSVLALLPAVAGGPTPASQIWGVRIAAVVLGAGASFALVDPMALLSVTPTPRWLRQWLRLAVVFIPAAAIWAGLFWVAGASAAPSRLPARDLVVEATVCGLAALAGAAVSARRGRSLTDALAGPATQGGLMVATLFLPAKYSAWPLPDSPQWDTVHDWWLGVLPVLAAALVVANHEVWPLRLRKRSGAATPDQPSRRFEKAEKPERPEKPVAGSHRGE